MSILKRHFDAIILGDSLAARIAGVLLAREGKSVLSLTEPPVAPSAWTMSSFHLDRLLETLDGASCRRSSEPVQFLTPRVRLEIHGAASLEEELKREFPSCHREVSNELETLKSLGGRLEEILFIEGQSPRGLQARGRFALRCLRRGIPLRTLRERIADYLRRRIPQPEAEAFTAFFAGLTLTPADYLTVAETALLWQGLVRPTTVDPGAFDDLLRHRYVQFHGIGEPLQRLQKLHAEGRRLVGATLSGHGRISGDLFLIGSKAGNSFLQKNLAPSLHSPPVASRVVSSPIDGALPPPLADRLVLGYPTPWRAIFAGEDGQTFCRMERSGSPGTGALPARAEEALRPFVPFADFHFTSVSEDDPAESAVSPKKAGAFGALHRTRVSKNLFLCEGRMVLPSLGMLGEVLTGFFVAGRLRGKEGKKR